MVGFVGVATGATDCAGPGAGGAEAEAGLGWLGGEELGDWGLGGVGAASAGSVLTGVGTGATAVGGAYLAGPHVNRGSVPATNAIMTGRKQLPPANKSTGTTTTRSGIWKSTTDVPARASAMKDVQIGTATREPVSSRPRLLGRSYPTHTPVASRGVYPMNHAFE